MIVVTLDDPKVGTLVGDTSSGAFVGAYCGASVGTGMEGIWLGAEGVLMIVVTLDETKLGTLVGDTSSGAFVVAVGYGVDE
mmetsp:Transcript_1083/g.1400  ORF Transcript_1083/g.1400 Transcript_1083/m.1400 type:complete len:81 (+) Transcript_1083:1-243(+)